MPSLDMYVPDSDLAERYIPREVGLQGVPDIDLYEIAIRNGAKATLLSGPTGSGKTEGIRAVCAKNGWPMYIVQGSNGTTKEEFCGGVTVNTIDPTSDRQFIANPGPLVKMMLGNNAASGYTEPTEYEHTVFVLDEINAIPSKVLLWLNSVNDNRRTLSLTEEAGTPVIVAHPGFSFFATMNEGHEYVGTKELNPAVRNRFNLLEVGYSHEAEDILLAEDPWVIRVRNKLREAMVHKQIGSTISTRALVDLRTNMRTYASLGDEQATNLAIEMFINNCLNEDRDTIRTIISAERAGGSGIKRQV